MAYHSKPIRMAKTPKQVKTIAGENWKQQNESFIDGEIQVVISHYGKQINQGIILSDNPTITLLGNYITD